MKKFQIDTNAGFSESQQIVHSPIVPTRPIQIPNSNSSSIYSFRDCGSDICGNYNDIPPPPPPLVRVLEDKGICKSPSDGVFSPVSRRLISKKILQSNMNSEQDGYKKYRGLVAENYCKKVKNRESSLLWKKNTPSPSSSASAASTLALNISTTPPHKPESPTDMFLSPCSKKILRKTVPKPCNVDSKISAQVQATASEMNVIQNKLKQLKFKKKRNKKHTSSLFDTTDSSISPVPVSLHQRSEGSSACAVVHSARVESSYHRATVVLQSHTSNKFILASQLNIPPVTSASAGLSMLQDIDGVEMLFPNDDISLRSSPIHIVGRGDDAISGEEANRNCFTLEELDLYARTIAVEKILGLCCGVPTNADAARTPLLIMATAAIAAMEVPGVFPLQYELLHIGGSAVDASLLLHRLSSLSSKYKPLNISVVTGVCLIPMSDINMIEKNTILSNFTVCAVGEFHLSPLPSDMVGRIVHRAPDNHRPSDCFCSNYKYFHTPCGLPLDDAEFCTYISIPVEEHHSIIHGMPINAANALMDRVLVSFDDKMLLHD